MFFLTVNFKQHSDKLNFSYNSLAEAEKSYDFIRKGFGQMIEINDEYGQFGTFHTNDVLNFFVSDNDKLQKAIEERSIAQARTQALTNRRASADPVINNQLITKPLMN